MIQKLLIGMFLLCVAFNGVASAGLLEDLGTVEIAQAAFGTVPQGQSKTTTFEIKFGLHIKQITFQVISVPSPITISPMSGIIDGRKFTWTATLPSSAAPGDYTSVFTGTAFTNPIVIKVTKGNSSGNYNVPVSGVVTGFPYSMTPGELDFGFLTTEGSSKTFQLKRTAFGASAKDDYQVTVTAPFTVTPATGSLTGSQAQTITIGAAPGTVLKSASGTVTVKDVKSGIQKTIVIKGRLQTAVNQ